MQGPDGASSKAFSISFHQRPRLYYRPFTSPFDKFENHVLCAVVLAHIVRRPQNDTYVPLAACCSASPSIQLTFPYRGALYAASPYSQPFVYLQ